MNSQNLILLLALVLTMATSALAQKSPLELLTVTAPSQATSQQTTAQRGGVYYLFATPGDGGLFIQGIKWPKLMGKPNNIWTRVRNDTATTGCTGVVCVEAHSPREVMRVLRKGLIPKKGLAQIPNHNKRQKVYRARELKPSDSRIAGFSIYAHANLEGPFLGHNWGQLTLRHFARDARHSRKDPQSLTNSLENRLVQGAHINFFGCNTGTCKQGQVPISLSLAALWGKKKVLVRGRYRSGVGNSPISQFATFGMKDGVPTRLTVAANDYRINAPKKLETIKIKCETQEKAQALAEKYRALGCKVRLSSRKPHLKVRYKMATRKVTRRSTKHPVHLHFIQTVANSGLDTARRMFPTLRRRANQRLVKAIDRVKKANNGKLDSNDFHLWLPLYYPTIKLADVNKRWTIYIVPCEFNTQDLLTLTNYQPPRSPEGIPAD